MKADWISAAFFGLLAAWPWAVPCPARPTLGLPEPGLLLFGSATNAAGGLLWPMNGVTCQISGGPTLVTIPVTVVVVNGQFFQRQAGQGPDRAGGRAAAAAARTAGGSGLWGP